MPALIQVLKYPRMDLSIRMLIVSVRNVRMCITYHLFSVNDCINVCGWVMTWGFRDVIDNSCPERYISAGMWQDRNLETLEDKIPYGTYSSKCIDSLTIHSPFQPMSTDLKTPGCLL